MTGTSYPIVDNGQEIFADWQGLCPYIVTICPNGRGRRLSEFVWTGGHPRDVPDPCDPVIGAAPAIQYDRTPPWTTSCLPAPSSTDCDVDCDAHASTATSPASAGDVANKPTSPWPPDAAPSSAGHQHSAGELKSPAGTTRGFITVETAGTFGSGRSSGRTMRWPASLSAATYQADTVCVTFATRAPATSSSIPTHRHPPAAGGAAERPRPSPASR